MCVCVCVYIYVYIYTHIYTHSFSLSLYIYIYIHKDKIFNEFDMNLEGAWTLSGQLPLPSSPKGYRYGYLANVREVDKY